MPPLPVASKQPALVGPSWRRASVRLSNLLGEALGKAEDAAVSKVSSIDTSFLSQLREQGCCCEGRDKSGLELSLGDRPASRLQSKLTIKQNHFLAPCEGWMDVR